MNLFYGTGPWNIYVSKQGQGDKLIDIKVVLRLTSTSRYFWCKMTIFDGRWVKKGRKWKGDETPYWEEKKKEDSLTHPHKTKLTFKEDLEFLCCICVYALMYIDENRHFLKLINQFLKIPCNLVVLVFQGGVLLLSLEGVTCFSRGDHSLWALAVISSKIHLE